MAEEKSARSKLLELTELQPFATCSAVAKLPDWVPGGDDEDDQYRSTLRLFEDGVEIGPPHLPHDQMDAQGGGAYSHWRNQLFFTATNGPSPAHNGRRYTALIQTGDLSPLSLALAQVNEGHSHYVGTEAGYALLERLAAELEPSLRLSERGRSCFSDTKFLADFTRFARGVDRSFDRKFVMRDIARFAAQLPGDMAECGVYRGGTAWFMAKALRERPGALLHLFDSFQGLSQPSGVDGSHWRAGDLAIPLIEVREALGPMESAIRYWPGWIPNEFHNVRSSKFSLVHIDVDLAEPTWDSLTFFYPRLVSNGIIVCDDYGFETCPGAREAMDAYFGELNIPIIHLPTGQGLAIKTAAA
jgi:O-methyltransferase